jgi:hypothetical protein
MDSIHTFLEHPNGSPSILFTYRCQSHNLTQHVTFQIDSFSSTTSHRLILYSSQQSNGLSPYLSPFISLQINNSLLAAERLLGTVYDITTLCQIGINSLLMSFRENLDPSGYEFIIQWIQIALMDEIIVKTKKLDIPLCLDRIRESFLVDLNSEIPDTSAQLLSLWDEKTKERIKIPARGDKCIHISCFDLKSWLKQNQTSLVFHCDLCHQVLGLEDIIIDSYILEILENTSVTVQQVSITMDGTWHCINSLSNSDICSNTSRAKQRDKVKKKNQVDESRRESMEHWNEEVARLVKLNIIKITENGTYNCLLCDTGGMTITTLMISHVLGKKHLICQRNFTSDNRSDKIRKKSHTAPLVTPHKKNEFLKKTLLFLNNH